MKSIFVLFKVEWREYFKQYPLLVCPTLKYREGKGKGLYSSTVISLLQGPGRSGRHAHTKDVRTKIVLIGSQICTQQFAKQFTFKKPYCEETEGICLYVTERGARVQIFSLDNASEAKSSLRGFSPWRWTYPVSSCKRSRPLVSFSEPSSALLSPSSLIHTQLLRTYFEPL